MIIYPQYPEARLSGFDPVDGNMPFVIDSLHKGKSGS